jgi:hypothetical protein
MNESKKKMVASALSVLFAMTILTSGSLFPASAQSQSDGVSAVGEDSSACK